MIDLPKCFALFLKCAFENEFVEMLLRCLIKIKKIIMAITLHRKGENLVLHYPNSSSHVAGSREYKS